MNTLFLNKICPGCTRKMTRLGNLEGIFYPKAPLDISIPKDILTLPEIKAQTWEEIYICSFCKIQQIVEINPDEFFEFAKKEIKNYRLVE